jgi:hypothetical protein
MSHVAKIELEIHDLKVLEAACLDLGFAFHWNQTRYKWFGSWVGDYPLPEDFTKEELGRCNHAINIPGAAYEIGVVLKGGKWILLWDFWGSGGLAPFIGQDGGKLKAAYAVRQTVAVARQKHYGCTQQKTKTGTRLIIRVG